MDGYGTRMFGELNAERYDAIYDDMIAETNDSAATLAELADGGRVLEFAVGTGRVALSLAACGLSVSGIEASEAMVEKLREKPGGSDIPVVIGDMAEVRVEGRFDLIYLVFNTIFNLTTQEAQVRCFKNAERHLSERGVFVVETVVPDFSEYVDGQRMKGSWANIEAARFEIAIHDRVAQTVAFQRIVISEEGTRPDGLDLPALLYRIENEMRDAAPEAQWTMNWALGEIGIHFPDHRERALAIGETLGIYRDYPVSKGCISPFVPIWINEMVSRQ